MVCWIRRMPCSIRGVARPSEPHSSPPSIQTQNTSNSEEWCGDRVIELRRLKIAFPCDAQGPRIAVRDVSLKIAEGERVGIVGESGSGKSLTALACLGLVPEPGRFIQGSVLANGRDLSTFSSDELRTWRGGAVGFCFQEGSDALNPVYSVGFQLRESICCKRGIGKIRAGELARDLLVGLGVNPVDQILGAYPHQLSGGQAQRVMLALSLSGDPHLLIADEPTSALDTITKIEILSLLEQLVRDRGLALLLISHDLEIVRDTVDRVAVMYDGEIVEEAPAAELFREPLHPYTQLLLESAPGAPHRHRRRAQSTDGFQTATDFGACSFVSRCAVARFQCSTARPELVAVGADRRLRCPVHAEAWEGHRVED